MKLDEYAATLGKNGVERLAKKIGANPVYLTHLIKGHSKAGVRIAVLIELASGGKVTLKDLRPDSYAQAKKDMKAIRGGKAA